MKNAFWICLNGLVSELDISCKLGFIGAKNERYEKKVAIPQTINGIDENHKQIKDMEGATSN